MLYVEILFENQGKTMSGKNHGEDAIPEDLADLAADLLKGISAEPVPQHLVALAQELQAALERQANKGPANEETRDQS